MGCCQRTVHQRGCRQLRLSRGLSVLACDSLGCAGGQQANRPYSHMNSSSSFGPERDADRSNGYDSDGLFNGAAANSAAHHSNHGLAGENSNHGFAGMILSSHAPASARQTWASEGS